MAKYAFKTIDVEVDISQVLEDMDDEDILEEVKLRGLSIEASEIVPEPTIARIERRMRDALYRNEPLTEIVRDYLKARGYCA